MANNLTALVPKIIAMSLPILRANCSAVQLVNRAYDMEAKGKGSTIDVPVPQEATYRDVVPGPTPPSDTPDLSTKTRPITMNKWIMSDFSLTDKEKLEVLDGIMPMSMQAAIAALGEGVNSYVLSLYKQFYNAVGTPGTNAFQDGIDPVFDAAVMLTENKVPLQDRKGIINPFTHGKALRQPEFRDYSQSSDNGPIIRGELGQKVGFDWYVDQGVAVHTAGTATGITTATLNAVKAETVTLKVASGTGTLVEGDIITFANHTQQYRVVADATLNTTGVAVSIEPPLKVAVDGTSVAVTVNKAASHTANLIFNPLAIALASRPLEGTMEQGLGVVSQTVLDPVTKLVFRFQILRGFMKTWYVFDILFGAKAVRPELGLRLFS